MNDRSDKGLETPSESVAGQGPSPLRPPRKAPGEHSSDPAEKRLSSLRRNAPDFPGEASGEDLVGTLLADRYEVLEFVGQGSSGRVYRVKDNAQAREVALKILRPALRSDPRLLHRFRREMELSQKVRHPHCIRIFEVGESDQGPFFTMEFLDGEDLQVVVDHESPLPDEQVAMWMIEILSGLSAAHKAGIVHRDLKAENIFLVQQEDRRSIRICDFGIAKALDGEVNITLDGFVPGTPHAMAPEQAKGEAVDHRADIYAAGVLLYQLLTGRFPFVAETPMDVLQMHVSIPPEPPSSVRPPGSPPHAILSRIALKALQKDPAHRFQSAEEMQQLVERASRHKEKAPQAEMPSNPMGRFFGWVSNLFKS